LNEVRVPYPTEARARGIQGNVVFEILISSDGRVREMKVISSPDPVLTNAAQSAVSAFKFRPARMADKPVAIRIRYTYRFLLQ
jgi:TonB family protein